MQNSILVTLLALVVGLVSGVAVPTNFDASKVLEGNNNNYCTGVIGFYKINLAGRGSRHEHRVKPEDRVEIDLDLVAGVVDSPSCKESLGYGCKMILCNLSPDQQIGNPCGFSSFAPGKDSVNPDANNGDHVFFDPKCFKKD